MAYNGRYISIHQVVENVFRDAGFDKVDWESAIAWTVQLMGKIGITYQYIEIDTNGEGYNPPPISVENYRGMLPTGFVNIKSARRVQIDDLGNIVDFRPMIASTDVYHQTNLEEEYNNPTAYDPVARVTNFTLDEYGDLEAEDNFIQQDKINYTNTLPNTYKIQGDYIFTDFKEGNIELVYTSYPIDNEGFPMIPDDEKYISALEYYITYKLDWKRWRRNPASPGLKAVVNDSEQQYLFAVASARTKAHIPSVDQMESLKNMWLRSIPKPNEHSNGFKTLNIQERRYNQYPNKRR